MTPSLEIDEHGDAVTVTLGGELDISNAAAVEGRLIALEESRPAALVLDLRQVSFIDSTGLSLLINADSRARKAGRRLTIVPGEGAVERTLRTVGLDERLDIDPESTA
jgi:anti-sigma B factor antagonist